MKKGMRFLRDKTKKQKKDRIFIRPSAMKDRIGLLKSKVNNTTKNKILVRIIAILVFIFSLFLAFLCYRQIMSVYKPTDILQVKEKHNITYQVYLKENEYINAPYLGMDHNYLYNYTDYIKLNDAYSVSFNENLGADYNYKMLATLVVKHTKNQSSTNNPEIMSKSFPLKENSGKFSKTTNFNDSLDLNLEPYKAAAEKFSSTLSVPASAELRIDFITKLIGEGDRFNSEYIRSVTIPLSEQVYKITLSENKEKISDFNVTNKRLFSIPFIAICLGIALCYAVVFLSIKKSLTPASDYKKTLDKYLKVYNDNIVAVSSPLNFSKYETVIIDDFKELLDLYKNTNVPIIFYENNQGGLFYILYNNMLFLHIVKK